MTGLENENATIEGAMGSNVSNAFNLDAKTIELVDFMRRLSSPTPAKSSRGRGSGRAGRAKVTASRKNRASLENDLSADVSVNEDILRGMMEEMKGIRGDLAAVLTKVTNLDTKFNEMEKRLSSLETENRTLKDNLKMKDVELRDLGGRMDNIEQQGKSLEVIVSSPDLSALSEINFKENFVALSAGKLRLSNEFLNRFSVRRVGKDGRMKALLRAPDHKARSELFTAARTVKPDRYYVNDSLIKSRDDLFYKIRKFKRDNNLNFSVYSFKGDICCKRDRESNSVKVHSIEEVIAKFGTPVN